MTKTQVAKVAVDALGDSGSSSVKRCAVKRPVAGLSEATVQPNWEQRFHD